MGDPPPSAAEGMGRFVARHRWWLLAAVVVCLGYGLYRWKGSAGPDRWNGWIYPSGLGGSEHDWIPGGPFPSLPACRAWVDGIVQQRFNGVRPPRFDYECGLNCRPERGLNVCEETRE